MNENSLPPGSQPVVKINGERVRRLREQQGLTQLYVATCVGVTTDTISRWENRRYPTIKKENAVKLAEALETPLDDIIDQEEPSAQENIDISEERLIDPNSFKPPVSVAVRKMPWLIIAGAIIAFLAVIIYWKMNPLQPPTTVTATRHLPPHMAIGQSFPVLILISNETAQPLSLIIKESIPVGCEVTDGLPPFTTRDDGRHFIKWISKASQGTTSFAYLLRITADDDSRRQLDFNGDVTLAKSKGAAVAIAGDRILNVRDFHWADTNGDFVIDDEEILAVYDVFGTIEGLNFDRDLVDAIWSGSGYRWDNTAHNFIILP